MRAAVISQIKRITKVGEQHFRTGPIDSVLEPGWQLAYQSEQQETPKAKMLAPLGAIKADQKVTEQEAATNVLLNNVHLEAQVTRPPPRYSEASLLGLMERAGQQTEDRQFKAALRAAEGLGTAATRADIIQNLKTKSYVDKNLRPTAKGIILIQTLDQLGLEGLQSVELTAKMEVDLKELEDLTLLEKNSSRATNFPVNEVAEQAAWRQADGLMAQVAEAISMQVDAIKAQANRSACQAPIEPSLTCPCCGKKIIGQIANYVCHSQKCRFNLPKTVAGRYLHPKLLRELLGAKRQTTLTGPLTATTTDQQSCSKSRSKKSIDNEVTLTLQKDKSGDLSLFIDGKSTVADLTHLKARSPENKPSDRRRLGNCPTHPTDCSVVETARSYICTSRLSSFRAGVANPEGFMVPKTLCHLKLPESAI